MPTKSDRHAASLVLGALYISHALYLKSTIPEAEAVSAWFYPLPLWPSNRDLAAEC